MISTRCTGLNLLNYLNQKNIDYSLNYEQIDPPELTWKATLIFNNNTYISINQKKQSATENAIHQATDSIFAYLKQ